MLSHAAPTLCRDALHAEIVHYLVAHREAFPDALLLAAVTDEPGRNGAPEGGASEPGTCPACEMLAGIAEVSLSAATRARHLTLRPPAVRWVAMARMCRFACAVACFPPLQEKRLNRRVLSKSQEAGYLSNMAVRERHRRRGVARALLCAAEELTRRLHRHALYLHSHLEDESALAFYQKAGFEEVGRDRPLVRVVGLEPRALLCKQLLAEEAE